MRQGRVSETPRLRGELRCERRPRRCLEELTGDALEEVAVYTTVPDGELLAAGGKVGFPEIPAELLHDDGWTVHLAKSWRRSDHITALEAEAVALNVRRIIRTPDAERRKHLVVCDNMSVIAGSRKVARPRIVF